MRITVRLAAIVFVATSAYGCDACKEELAPTETSEVHLSQPLVVTYAAGDLAECFPGHPNSAYTGGRYGHELVADLLATLRLDGVSRIFLALGDIAYYQGTPEQFLCYDKSFGRFKSATKFTPGNHEYQQDKTAAAYYSYTGLPQYYTFNPVGDYWHIVSGNSNFVGAEKQSYLAWLEADLSQNTRPCTLVFFHEPRYSSGDVDMSTVADEFSILYKHHVTLLLSGHDHAFEKFRPMNDNGQIDEANGVVQFVVGTGGADRGQKKRSMSASEFWDGQVLGVLELILGPGDWSWRFVPVPETGSGYSGPPGKCHG